jgi:transposase-like protein
MSGTSYCIDETYIKAGRLANISIALKTKKGKPLSSFLQLNGNVPAAKRFFKKIMIADHRRLPFSISVDLNAAYPEAFTSFQYEKILPKDCTLRRVKYLNNLIEQDHGFIKKKVRSSRCFKRFHTAGRTLEGIESMNKMKKGQVKRLDRNDAIGQARFVESLSQIAT